MLAELVELVPPSREREELEDELDSDNYLLVATGLERSPHVGRERIADDVRRHFHEPARPRPPIFEALLRLPVQHVRLAVRDIGRRVPVPRGRDYATPIGYHLLMEAACWICGAAATSSEHRLKKSDLVRAHGRGPYKGPKSLAHYRDGKETLVQGPNSAVVKYAPSLCHGCNTSRTQPFDRSYDAFMAWLLANEEVVLRRRFVSFPDAFGEGWERAQRDLYKYFAKSFGCRLIDAGTGVPGDVVELLGKESFLTELRLTFAVNEDVLNMPPCDRDGFIGKGELVAWGHPAALDKPSGYTWSEHVSWFTVNYWYSQYPCGPAGSVWMADVTGRSI